MNTRAVPQIDSETLDRIFGALSDPTRRRILAELEKSERPAMWLLNLFEMSLPGLSKHLDVLEKAGLITSRIDGRAKICKINLSGFQPAKKYLSAPDVAVSVPKAKVTKSEKPAKTAVEETPVNNLAFLMKGLKN